MSKFYNLLNEDKYFPMLRKMAVANHPVWLKWYEREGEGLHLHSDYIQAYSEFLQESVIALCEVLD